MESDLPLEEQLRQARALTDRLFRIVCPDSLYERPIPERHRMIFYLGHLEAFDWNLAGRYALDLPSFHPTFDRLFAFGIDPAEGDLPTDQPSDWPSIAETAAYNARTRAAIDEVLPNLPDRILHTAIEHRLMHAETFTYILHHLAYERKLAQPETAAPSDRDPEPLMLDIPAGSARLGLSAGEGFGWDNEYQSHSVEVPQFAISKYKVTNADYLEFVAAGGPAPFFWAERNGEWFYRGMFREMPLPLDWPVYVTKCQAEQYAGWRGFVLPTEPQFHRAAEGLAPSRNVDFRYWDPIPVTADDRPGEQAPMQLVGNGWEWTSTIFGPFPGFEPFPFYSNYSAPFFDGRHFVLKGASSCTARRFLRPSFRNWFRPSYPYIYATFRLVRS